MTWETLLRSMADSWWYTLYMQPEYTESRTINRISFHSIPLRIGIWVVNWVDAVLWASHIQLPTSEGRQCLSNFFCWCFGVLARISICELYRQAAFYVVRCGCILQRIKATSLWRPHWLHCRSAPGLQNNVAGKPYQLSTKADLSTNFRLATCLPGNYL